MTYTAESHTTTTYYEEVDGLLLLCDNETILCDSVEYDCNGDRIFRTDSHTTLTYSKETY